MPQESLSNKELKDFLASIVPAELATLREIISFIPYDSIQKDKDPSIIRDHLNELYTDGVINRSTKISPFTNGVTLAWQKTEKDSSPDTSTVSFDSLKLPRSLVTA